MLGADEDLEHKLGPVAMLAESGYIRGGGEEPEFKNKPPASTPRGPKARGRRGFKNRFSAEIHRDPLKTRFTSKLSKPSRPSKTPGTKSDIHAKLAKMYGPRDSLPKSKLTEMPGKPSKPYTTPAPPTHPLKTSKSPKASKTSKTSKATKPPSHGVTPSLFGRPSPAGLFGPTPANPTKPGEKVPGHLKKFQETIKSTSTSGSKGGHHFTETKLFAREPSPPDFSKPPPAPRSTTSKKPTSKPEVDLSEWTAASLIGPTKKIGEAFSKVASKATGKGMASRAVGKAPGKESGKEQKSSTDEYVDPWFGDDRSELHVTAEFTKIVADCRAWFAQKGELEGTQEEVDTARNYLHAALRAVGLQDKMNHFKGVQGDFRIQTNSSADNWKRWTAYPVFMLPGKAETNYSEFRHPGWVTIKALCGGGPSFWETESTPVGSRLPKELDRSKDRWSYENRAKWDPRYDYIPAKKSSRRRAGALTEYFLGSDGDGDEDCGSGHGDNTPFGNLRGGAAPENLDDSRAYTLEQRSQFQFSKPRRQWGYLKRDAAMGLWPSFPASINELKYIAPLMYPDRDMEDSLRGKHRNDFEGLMKKFNAEYDKLKTSSVEDQQRLLQATGNPSDSELLEIKRFLSEYIITDQTDSRRYGFSGRADGGAQFRKALRQAFSLRAWCTLRLHITKSLFEAKKLNVKSLLHEERNFYTALQLHERVWMEYDMFRRWFMLKNKDTLNRAHDRAKLREHLIIRWQERINFINQVGAEFQTYGEKAYAGVGKDLLEGDTTSGARFATQRSTKGKTANAKGTTTTTTATTTTASGTPAKDATTTTGGTQTSGGASELPNIEWLKRIRQVYKDALNEAVKKNEKLDPSDPADRPAIQINNIDIMAKNQLVWSLDVEIENHSKKTGEGAKMRWTLPPSKTSYKQTKQLIGRRILPTNVTSLYPSAVIPGSHQPPRLSKIIVGGRPGMGLDPPVFTNPKPIVNMFDGIDPKPVPPPQVPDIKINMAEIKLDSIQTLMADKNSVLELFDTTMVKDGIIISPPKPLDPSRTLEDLAPSTFKTMTNFFAMAWDAKPFPPGYYEKDFSERLNGPTTEVPELTEKAFFEHAEEVVVSQGTALIGGKNSYTGDDLEEGFRAMSKLREPGKGPTTEHLLWYIWAFVSLLKGGLPSQLEHDIALKTKYSDDETSDGTPETPKTPKTPITPITPKTPHKRKDPTTGWTFAEIMDMEFDDFFQPKTKIVGEEALAKKRYDALQASIELLKKQIPGMDGGGLPPSTPKSSWDPATAVKVNPDVSWAPAADAPHNRDFSLQQMRELTFDVFFASLPEDKKADKAGAQKSFDIIKKSVKTIDAIVSKELPAKLSHPHPSDWSWQEWAERDYATYLKALTAEERADPEQAIIDHAEWRWNAHQKSLQDGHNTNGAPTKKRKASDAGLDPKEGGKDKRAKDKRAKGPGGDGGGGGGRSEPAPEGRRTLLKSKITDMEQNGWQDLKYLLHTYYLTDLTKNSIGQSASGLWPGAVDKSQGRPGFPIPFYDKQHPTPGRDIPNI